MAGMKRFVTYIYAYEEEKKGSNVGFARIEIRDRMQELRFICAASMRRRGMQSVSVPAGSGRREGSNRCDRSTGR